MGGSQQTGRQHLKALMLATTVVLLLAACGADATPTPIPPAPTPTTAPTPTLEATPTEAAIAIAVASRVANGPRCAGLALSSVQIDTMGLPYPWQPNCIEATPYDKSRPPGPKGLPQHLQVNFGNVDPANVKPNDPIIYIIPVAEYKKLWGDSSDPAVSNSLDKLSTMLKDKPEPIPTSGMPVLPYERVTGRNDLSVQGKYLEVESGSGVRFVGRFAQSPAPVTNDNPQLFYIYQGYTPDNKYLVSFFYPVSTKALPMAATVNEAERAQVDSDSTAYMQSKAQQLNALSDSDWSPPLSQLDAVIKSLKFGN